MAQQPPEAKRIVQPVGRESVLHSEVTMYHPTGEEHPEVDKETSSERETVSSLAVGFGCCYWRAPVPYAPLIRSEACWTIVTATLRYAICQG